MAHGAGAGALTRGCALTQLSAIARVVARLFRPLFRRRLLLFRAWCAFFAQPQRVEDLAVPLDVRLPLSLVGRKFLAARQRRRSRPLGGLFGAHQRRRSLLGGLFGAEKLESRWSS